MKKKKFHTLFEAPPEDPNAVYVGTLEYRYGDMIMSHMGSPNLDKLHQMAQSIGIARKHFQDDEDHLHPHYDVCKSMKAKAIKLGAIEIDDKELINRCYPDLERKLFADDVVPAACHPERSEGSEVTNEETFASLKAFNTSLKKNLL